MNKKVFKRLKKFIKKTKILTFPFEKKESIAGIFLRIGHLSTFTSICFPFPVFSLVQTSSCVLLWCLWAHICMYQSNSVWKTVFPLSHASTLVATDVPPPLWHRCLRLEGISLIKDIIFGSKCFSFSAENCQIWVSVLIIMNYKEELLFEWETDLWI